MFLESILAITIGLIFGVLTGLAPGIHINLVSAFIISKVTSISDTSALYVSLFIVSLAITHTILDFIPSVYLGAPEEDTYLSVLPGHELLKQGKGHEAVSLAVSGAIIGIIILLVLSPILIFTILPLEKIISKAIPFILIAVSLYIILREKKTLTALMIFVAAGFLGYVSFNLPVKDPLLPLLTGLFGASTIILSIRNKIKVPKQKESEFFTKPNKKEIKKIVLPSLIVAPWCTFLPALGSGYAALISSEIANQSRRSFMALTGLLNTFIMAGSFLIVYLNEKTRTGAAAAIKELIAPISGKEVSIILIAALISSLAAAFIALFISKKCANYINKINYRMLSIIIAVILILVVLIFSNSIGFLILAASTSLGIATISSEVKRTHLMGALIIPTIIYYLV